MAKEWIVEVPEGLFTIEDVEKYLNSIPHPGYDLFDIQFRWTMGSLSRIASLVWKRQEG